MIAIAIAIAIPRSFDGSAGRGDSSLWNLSRAPPSESAWFNQEIAVGDGSQYSNRLRASHLRRENGSVTLPRDTTRDPRAGQRAGASQVGEGRFQWRNSRTVLCCWQPLVTRDSHWWRDGLRRMLLYKHTARRDRELDHELSVLEGEIDGYTGRLVAILVDSQTRTEQKQAGLRCGWATGWELLTGYWVNAGPFLIYGVAVAPIGFIAPPAVSNASTAHASRTRSAPPATTAITMKRPFTPPSLSG